MTLKCDVKHYGKESESHCIDSMVDTLERVRSGGKRAVIQANDDLDFSNSTILITGASGMVGSSATKKVLKRWPTTNVVAIVRNKEKAKHVLREYLNNPRLLIIEQDICRPLKYVGMADYIIHTAGVTGGSKQHVDYPMSTIKTALDGTTNILEYARQKASKGMVYLSSLEIYGKVPEETNNIIETDGGYIDPTNIRSSYSESKRMCECICASYARQYGVPVTIARLTATFGPGTSYNDNRVFAQFAKAIIEGKDIVLKSTGETVRNYCDVDDCTDALIILLQKGLPGEAYNIANEATEISIKKLAERFISLFPESGSKLVFDIAKDITKLGYNSTIKVCLNASKLKRLGWEPHYDIDQMIHRLVSAMKEIR